MLMRVQDEFIELDGARLRLRIAGSGAAVLFIHGWALDLDMWEAQFAALADSYRVIAFDRRGFGLSTGEPGIERDVADLERLLGALEVEQPAIVGMSQGARVALRWASRHPGRTACLVLDGPPREALSAGGTFPEEIPTAHYRDLLRRSGIETVRTQWLGHPLMRLRTGDARTQALLHEIVARYPGRDLVTESGGQPLSGEDLSRLEVRSLVINGEDDTAGRRAAGAELASMLPCAQSVLIRRAGHLATLDNPQEYNRVLGAFLGSFLRPTREPSDQSEHMRRSHAD